MTGHAFWLTGLSGAGKSTLAHRLYEWFLGQGIHPVLLDGDAIRDMLLEPARHDRESRLKIAQFNARLCRFLALQGLTVICPTISLFHEVQAWNREHTPSYVEVFLDVPLEEVRRRDSKGVYGRFAQGEISDVVGEDITAEFPLQPDVHLHFSPGVTVDEWMTGIIDHIKATQRHTP